MRIWSTLRSSLVAGVALIAPLVVTVFTLQFLVEWVAKSIDPIVQETRLAAYTGNVEIAAQLLAVAVIVGLIAVLGYVAQRSFGERLFGLVDRGVGVGPLARVIYASVRQVSDALLARSNRFESTVLVEYPWEGIYSIGFVTGESPDPVGTAAGQSGTTSTCRTVRTRRRDGSSWSLRIRSTTWTSASGRASDSS